MTAATTGDRRQQVVKILVDMIENDAYNNDIHYIWASDIAEEDPDLSGSVVGTYLSDMEDDSPLSNGLEIERYTDTRCGPSLWTVRKRDRS